MTQLLVHQRGRAGRCRHCDPRTLGPAACFCFECVFLYGGRGVTCSTSHSTAHSTTHSTAHAETTGLQGTRSRLPKAEQQAPSRQGLRVVLGLRFRAHPFCIFSFARHPGLCLVVTAPSAHRTARALHAPPDHHSSSHLF